MKSAMNVLGIHALSSCSGACLITTDGIHAVSSERLTRIPRDGRFPLEAIRYVMKAGGVKELRDIHLVVFDHFQGRIPARQTLAFLRAMGYRNEVACILHDEAHAAAAFFSSPFDSATVLVTDDMGPWNGRPKVHDGRSRNGNAHLSSSLAIYSGNGITLQRIHRRFEEPRMPFGIGGYYHLASSYLGLQEEDPEPLRSLAALATRQSVSSFGEAPGFAAASFSAQGRSPWSIDMARNLHYHGRKLFGRTKPRIERAPISRMHAVTASCVQKKVEDAVLQVARRLLAVSGRRNFCHAGYLAGHSNLNMRLAEEMPWAGFFVHPANTDTAIPLGSALYGYHVIKRREREAARNCVFLGRTYGRGHILAALRSARGIQYAKPAGLLREVAAYLSEGYLVGWFEGAAEIGPTALGHRSILADPRDSAVVKRLTTEVKQGEWFDTYPVCIPERKSAEYFETGLRSPFMEFSAKVRAGKRHLFGGALRPDGTVRAQTIVPSILPRLHTLLEAYHDSSGIPSLIHSSLCTAGEPIAESPQDAVNCFLNTGLDFLVLEGYLCWKPHTRRAHAKR